MRSSSLRVSPLRLFLACAVAAAAGVAHAQMPPMRVEGAGSYVCGGIGTDESIALRAAMKDHPLSLLFARADGAYLADVSVVIQRAGEAPALSLRAGGPVCLVDLPAGRYTVEATAGGVSKRQDVTLGGAPRSADFRF